MEHALTVQPTQVIKPFELPLMLDVGLRSTVNHGRRSAHLWLTAVIQEAEAQISSVFMRPFISTSTTAATPIFFSVLQRWRWSF